MLARLFQAFADDVLAPGFDDAAVDEQALPLELDIVHAVGVVTEVRRLRQSSHCCCTSTNILGQKI
jgi:hypothetical protein